MLLASVGMVLYMPVAVPLMVEGLTVTAWTIAKPLLVLVLLPLVIGMAILQASTTAASRLRPFVKKTTDVATIVMLALCVVVYGKGFIGSAGSYATLTQMIFFGVVTAASYGLAFGLPQSQKSVLSLGLCTRNLGAALPPLFTPRTSTSGRSSWSCSGSPCRSCSRSLRHAPSLDVPRSTIRAGRRPTNESSITADQAHLIVNTGVLTHCRNPA